VRRRLRRQQQQQQHTITHASNNTKTAADPISKSEDARTETSCFGNGSGRPHRRRATPLLRAIGCTRPVTNDPFLEFYTPCNINQSINQSIFICIRQP